MTNCAVTDCAITDKFVPALNRWKQFIRDRAIQAKTHHWNCCLVHCLGCRFVRRTRLELGRLDKLPARRQQLPTDTGLTGDVCSTNIGDREYIRNRYLQASAAEEQPTQQPIRLRCWRGCVRRLLLLLLCRWRMMPLVSIDATCTASTHASHSLCHSASWFFLFISMSSSFRPYLHKTSICIIQLFPTR